MTEKKSDNSLSRRTLLTSTAAAVGAGVVLGGSDTASAQTESSTEQTKGFKRDFEAIDWSMNAWLPGGIGARFAGIGIPELGICNRSTPWTIGGKPLPYSTNRREEMIKGYSPEFLIERMDLGRVEKGGLIACWAAEGVGGKDCRVEADEVYAVVNKHPDRFFGLVGVSPLPDKGSKHYGPKYIEHAITQLGFKAVHSYPQWFGIRVDDERMFPIYETCAKLGVPFLYQLGTGSGMSGSRVCALPEWNDNIVRHFPEMTIVGIHPASLMQDMWIMMLAKDPNVYWGLDAMHASRWAQPKITNLLKNKRDPGYAKAKQDFQDKIMWATDFPVQDPAVALEEFEEMVDIPYDIAKKVLRDNAIRIFKL